MKVTYTDVPLSHFAGRNPRGSLIQTKQGKRILAMAQRAMALGGAVEMETFLDVGTGGDHADPAMSGQVYERMNITIDTAPESSR